MGNGEEVNGNEKEKKPSPKDLNSTDSTFTLSQFNPKIIDNH